MRLKWVVILLVVGGALLVSKWKSPVVALGCYPATSDGQIDPSPLAAFWNNQPVVPPTTLADNLSAKDKQVLGTSSDKWIEVDLSDQKLIAHQGDSIFLESLISSGLWGRTPAGEYAIWYKIRATKMEGGSKANRTYYYLPNVPYTMFYHGNYAVHGTYWHQNFGQPMSHGCVNTPTPIAERLFYWADPQLPEGKLSVRSTADNPGTRVIVHQ